MRKQKRIEQEMQNMRVRQAGASVFLIYFLGIGFGIGPVLVGITVVWVVWVVLHVTWVLCC